MKVIKPSYTPFSYCNYISDSSDIQQNIRQSEFCLRLQSQTYDTICNGGDVLMLTFTYSDKCLPRFYNPDTNEIVICFNRNDLRKFFNRLKVLFSRVFPADELTYKYFLCCEYGSNTKRPHYHALFFVSKGVDLSKFISLCRKAWTFGWMFPAPFGNVVQHAKLRSYEKGAAYASKYVCKDLSFYNLPAVDRLLKYRHSVKDDYKIFKKVSDCFPRIYQSNGIGASLVTQLENDFNSVLKNGLFNSLSKTYAPVPRYVYNKFFYKNVLAFDCRTGYRNRQLYDRILRVDSSYYINYKFNSLSKSADKMRPFFGVHSGIKDFPYRDFLPALENVKSFFKCSDTSFISKLVAVYGNYTRVYSSLMSDYITCFDDLFSVSVVKIFLELNSDTYSRYLENDTRVVVSSLTSSLDLNVEQKDVLYDLDVLYNSLQSYFDSVSLARIAKIREKWELKTKLCKNRYDVSLC